MPTQTNEGEMRLGGMTPATLYHPLPATFHITNTLQQDNTTIFFCHHTDQQGPPLTWIDQNTIIIHNKNYTLHNTAHNGAPSPSQPHDPNPSTADTNK